MIETDKNLSQGFRTVTDPETGRSFPIPEGASDAGVEGVGDEGSGTVQESSEGSEGVQSDSSGQGFLEPYLKDVPEEQRPVVEPILEKYRADQDANFNRRFEQLQEESKTPTMIYQALLDDPITTLNWIADRMQEERGLDVRSQLIDQWGNPTPKGQELLEDQNQQQQSQEGDKPLTKAEVDNLLQEREQQREQQLQQQEQQKQAEVQQQRTINNWIDGAAKSFGLNLEDKDGTPDPLRPVIIMQANQLHEQGVAKGQAAVEMAVEAISKRFGTSSSGNGNKGTQPKGADGGSPPPGQDIDYSDAKQRKARMEEMYTQPPSH